jgi:cellulose synthase/poly-beta-1,6-N-acetylglucosamine synthase-like glycosyltransferase
MAPPGDVRFFALRLPYPGEVDGTEPDYSIVIPAYNEEALLPGTLEQLRAAMAEAPFRGEVVVCDNNSNDRTGEAARAAGARVVFEPVNQISRARNAGARAARGRFLVFVDADTSVPPGLLCEALGALGGRACGGGATLAMEGVSHPLALRMVAGWNALSRRFSLAAGSFLFVRREAFRAVGGFSERVYASEEIWLSRALKRWGRAQGLDFVILDGHSLVTSGRKGRWYSPTLIFVTVLLMLLCPFLLRFRAFCWVWYRRPPAEGAS